MAEKTEQEKREVKLMQQKQAKAAEQREEKKKAQQEDKSEMLIRIFGYDIPGSKNLYSGLTRIKGVSWAISNAAILKLGLSRNKKISELTKPDIQQIETFLKNIDIYDYMKNRRSDPETGKTGHFYGSDLDVLKDFDIKRQKKMRSYVGVRHVAGQPVRGQRTRSHFRKKKIVKAGKKGVKK